MERRIVVIHPDLGLGGAERLIVDSSKALQECGHSVKIYTNHHDKGRCFEETRDGTIETITLGSWIPRTLFGKCHALMAYIKVIYISIYLVLFSQHDLVLCDQVSACIPFLKYLDFRNKSSRIVFYCHFPDQLLTQRQTTIKSIYRCPIDWFEEWSTSLANVILVNSKFTSGIVKRTFVSLKNRDLKILYPCVDVNSFASFRRNQQPHVVSSPSLSPQEIVVPSKSKTIVKDNLLEQIEQTSKDKFLFLSINRFERKKNLTLAVEAFSECLEGYELYDKHFLSDKTKTANQRIKSGAHLILAGGYDLRLAECVQYYEELEGLIRNLKLEDHVTLVKSPNDEEKLRILAAADAIIYTPENEHFGIVPIEAMAMCKPVIACASGGPLESVDPDTTGMLCQPDKYAFADAMLKLWTEPKLAARMGLAGLDRVQLKFSYEAFRDRIDELCFGRGVGWSQKYSNNSSNDSDRD